MTKATTTTTTTITTTTPTTPITTDHLLFLVRHMGYQNNNPKEKEKKYIATTIITNT